MTEFTGERVIPGQVEPDLWNEHLARYYFAARLAAGKRVLDAGCGSGYGSAELARTARAVLAIDNSPEALAYAKAHFSQPHLDFLQASAAALPLADGSMDLVVSFEVVEHLSDPDPFFREAARVLRSHGQFVVSTPNKDYYAESRAQSGPNPFHHREFTYQEFQDELRHHFASVSFFVQNHTSAVVFQPLHSEHAHEIIIEDETVNPEEAHFFLAVCAQRTQIGAPSFIYVPRTANVLRERERHIGKLEAELQQKNQWLAELQDAHQSLQTQHETLQLELETANRWATELDAKIKAAGERILQLQDEVATRNAWAHNLEEELNRKLAELATAVDALHATEAELARTTASYLAVRDHLDQTLGKLRLIRDSRWVKLGRTIRLGPDLTRESLD